MDLEAADDRVAELAQAFVELAGALADGYDVVELLDRLIRHCVHLLKVDAAGLVLADASGTLKVMAATDEQARFLEVLQLHADSGPCLDCYRSGQPVDVDDLTVDDDRWPALADTIRHGGYRAVHAVPLRFREQTLGAMNLFSTKPGGWEPPMARSPWRSPRWRPWPSWASARLTAPGRWLSNCSPP